MWVGPSDLRMGPLRPGSQPQEGVCASRYVQTGTLALEVAARVRRVGYLMALSVKTVEMAQNWGVGCVVEAGEGIGVADLGE